MGLPVGDMFCGVGALTHGFFLEGFDVVVGVDSDPSCRYGFEVNNSAKFIHASIEEISGEQLALFYPQGRPKVLVGCAPCQPFSNYTNKHKTKDQEQWELLREFGRIIRELQPEVVSMENVPSLGRREIFLEFIQTLRNEGYTVEWNNIFCPDYGVPQNRLRLVLLASKLGGIELVSPTHAPEEYRTVFHTIAHLPGIDAGEADLLDPLHRASNMSETNLKRIRSSVPGGTWRDWEEDLIAPCHRVASGESYSNVYGRMEWQKPSPTITTQFHGFGNGRFGHPEQDRAISLREGALLQTFPPDYEFVEPGMSYKIGVVARHIGNAVPVELGRAIAQSIRHHLEENGFGVDEQQ